MDETDAVVVGSGPNGLSAAIALARAGCSVSVYEAEASVGGGVRSAELTLPGFVHDRCSAIHPMAAASPFFREISLHDHGLQWIEPPLALAHPLDDGGAVTLQRSLDDTVAGLEADGGAYRGALAPLVQGFDLLLADVLMPMVRVPRHPLLFARFGLAGLLSAELFALGAFRTSRARALWAGLAAHSFLPLESPLSASFALVLAATAHAVGWPFPRGGASRIAEALEAVLRGLGGRIVRGKRVDRLGDLDLARAYVFDTSPRELERIAGERLPTAYRRALLRFRRAPAVFKVDYALAGPVPWKAPECSLAGTVHLGGTFAEIALAEREVARGRHAERPFVLVAQQSTFDPTRAPPGHHTLWAYCHVPNGSTVDMTSRIDAQIERFAPGFSGRVLARAITTPALLERHNANCGGGDIIGGANDGLQMFARPVLARDPYATPAGDLYLASASTPPGAGVHGMCGYNAARSALRRTFAA